MKKVLSTLVIAGFVLCAVLLIKVTEVEKVNMVFSPLGSTVYSPFCATAKNIRVGVERVAVHRYFTVYSYVTGDPSHMEVLLMFEHLKQLAIQKGQPEITVQDNLGNVLHPFPYVELQDFPTDDPLGYKMTLWVRFPPPEKEATHIDIDLKYLGGVYEIKSVPIR